MTVVKISELPQKDALEDGDKVIAWNSANGATSVLLGTAFTAIKEASATSASAAKASENAAKNLASEASSSADSASESASGAALSAEAAKASETNALASANSASASQTQIESDIAQAKLDITTERTAAVSAVEAAQATAISSIQTQGTESVTAVTAAQASSVSAVKAQEAASIQAIEAGSVLAGYVKEDELFGNDGAGPTLRPDILPAATADTPGAVTTGDGITNNNGKLTVDFSAYAKATDVAATYLPLTGGTMSLGQEAGIKFKGQAQICSYIDGAVCIRNLKDTTTPKIYMDNLGVGGGTLSYTNPGNYFAFSAAVKAPSFQATSDARKKTGLTPVHPDLSGLTAYRYTLKDDGKTHVGLVAQEVEKVIPEAVAEDKEGFLALDYNAVVAALVDEVNRLRERVEALEAAE